MRYVHPSEIRIIRGVEYHLVDIRPRQNYGEQWNNAHRGAEAKRWAYQQAKKYMFMQLYGATGAQLTASMSLSMAGVAASAVRAAAEFEKHFNALQELLKKVGPTGQIVIQSGKKSGKTSLLSHLRSLIMQPRFPPPHPSVSTPPARGPLWTPSAAALHQLAGMYVGVDEQHRERDRRRALRDRERRLDRADTNDAPDVADYCYGYRVWSVADDLLLRSIGVTDVWHPGQRKIAMCRPAYGRDVTVYCQGGENFVYYYREVRGQEPPDMTNVPGMDHSCGLWGQWNLDHLPEFPTDGQWPGGGSVVMGLIRAGGKVVESDYGFRAEWADIVELYCNGWDDSTLLDQLGVRYQVPVVRLTKDGQDVFADYYEMDEHDHLMLAHPDKEFKDWTPSDLYEED